MAVNSNPLFHSRYVRSNAYEAQWVFDNLMGPHPLWLMESLCEVMTLERGMRVLDLGCGTALTSIFLAREFRVQVWATDWWIDASDNHKRIVAAGVEDLVTPIHAEAHGLPFERGFFDAIVSVDAYHYFGTSDLYLGSMSDLLRHGGRIGIVVPGVFAEFGADVPDHLVPYWEWEFCSFHPPSWWRTHWEKTKQVSVDVADSIEDGWKDWLRFQEAAEHHAEGWRKHGGSKSIAMLRADQGELLGFSRILATKD